MHRFALPAARAAECAAAVGRFDSIVDALYSAQDSLGLVAWSTIALRAGVPDTAQFNQCVYATGPIMRVGAGAAAAARLQVSATPTLLINGWRYNGTLSDAALDSAIQVALSGKSPAASQ